MDVFRTALRRGDATLPGQLKIGGNRVPVTFAIRLTTEAAPAIEGRLQSTFSAPGITVPDVGPGSLVAAPKGTLNLFVRLPAADIPGADRLPADVLADSAPR